MAVTLESVQIELQRMFNLTHTLSQELSSANAKVDYLNNDWVAKDANIEELKQANRQLVNVMASSGGGGGGDRVSDIKLIDMKAMNPKSFDGKVESPFKAWAKKVRAYCNASRPGFRKFLKWVESQNSRVDFQVLSRCDRKFKDVASEVLYDFLLMHTSDDAQQLVELQDENGLEAWRQLVIRFDPVGESYAFDQMSALMEVPRCKHLVELPAAITRWERSLRAYADKTGGQAVPPGWKSPILFKMIPTYM